MKIRNLVLTASVAAPFVLGCSQTVAPPAAPSAVSEVRATDKGGVRQQAITIRARVEKIDQKERRVTLVGHDGVRETITVGDEVKNLAQVRKGDEVVVTYYQAVAFDVLPKGAKGAAPSAGEVMITAEPGEMPGGAAARKVKFVAEAVRLDPAHKTATLKLPDSSIETVEIQNPAVFDKVKAGDRVEITLAEAMAIDVARVPANP